MTLCGSGSQRRSPWKTPPDPRRQRSTGLVEAPTGQWAIIQPVDALKAPPPSKSDGLKEHNPPTPQRQALITAKSTLFGPLSPRDRRPGAPPGKAGSDDPREVDPGSSHAPAPPGLQTFIPPCVHASKSALYATFPGCQKMKNGPQRAGLCQPGSPPHTKPRPLRTAPPTYPSHEPWRHAPARCSRTATFSLGS